MIEIIINFLKYLKYEKNYSNNTVLSYGKDLKQFLDYLENLKITKFNNIDYKMLRNYLSLLYEKNYSKKTIARNISAIRSLFKYLMKDKIVTYNPITLISNPKLDKKLPKFLYYNDLEVLLNTPDINTTLGFRDATILECFYSTGLRISEITNIKINDISFDDMKILVNGKGNKERYVLFGTRLEKLLKKYIIEIRPILLKDNHEYLFVNKLGKQLTDRGIRFIVEEIFKKSSLKYHISPHTLRHTFATHLLDNGADLKVVQELLGHTNLNTTQIYTHISNEKLRNVYYQNHPRSKMR